jgi:hypothetical protein
MAIYCIRLDRLIGYIRAWPQVLIFEKDETPTFLLDLFLQP